MDGLAALRAWSELVLGARSAEAIELLQRRKKSTVLRLTGLDCADGPVIAKRCKDRIAVVERQLYEDVLPRLPVTSLRYFGSVPDQQEGFTWLFVEDAGRAQLSKTDRRHRRLAARWLATLHGTSSELPDLASLPDRGPAHYLEALAAARARLVQGIENPAAGRAGVALLESLVDRCDAIEEGWPTLEELCEGFPRTLVHGDFVPKNVRIRPTGPDGAHLELLPLDWETAGVAVAGVDLEHVDLEAYRIAIREWHGDFSRDEIRRLALAGQLLRWIVALSWESHSVTYDWVETPLPVEIHAERLATLGALTGVTVRAGS